MAADTHKLLEGVIDAGFEDVSEIQSDNDDIEAEIKAAIGADDNDIEWKIQVARIIDGRTKGNWIGDYNVNELKNLNAMLRDKYNGGDFEVRVMKNGRLNKRKTLHIEAPIKEEIPRGVGPSDIAILAQTMERNFQSMLQQMQAAQTQAANQASGGDPVQMMTALVGALASMKNLIPEAPKAEDNFSKFLDFYKLMKDATGENSAAGSNVMDVIRDVVKSPLVEQLQRQADAENARQRALPRPYPQQQNGTIPMPDQTQKQAAQTVPQPVQTSPQQAPETTSPFEQRINNVDATLNEKMPNPPQNVASQPEEIDWSDPQTMAALTSYINYLNGCATRGNTASLQAEVAWEQLEMSWIEMICDTPGIVDYLNQQFPETAPNREWFLNYVGELKLLLTEERNAVDTPQYDQSSPVHAATDQAGPGGHSPDIGHNGAIDPNGGEESPNS